MYSKVTTCVALTPFTVYTVTGSSFFIMVDWQFPLKTRICLLVKFDQKSFRQLAVTETEAGSLCLANGCELHA